MGGAYDAHFMKTLVIHVILPPLPVQEPQTLPPTPMKPSNPTGLTQIKPSPIPALMSLRLPPLPIHTSQAPALSDLPPLYISFLSQGQPQLSHSPSPPKKEYLKIGCWNVRGWGGRTGSNAREQLITNLNLDILCLCETFLVGKQEIQLNNYL